MSRPPSIDLAIPVLNRRGQQTAQSNTSASYIVAPNAPRRPLTNGNRIQRIVRATSVSAEETNAIIKWTNRLRLLNDLRGELLCEQGAEDIINNLESCISSLSKHMDSTFNRDNGNRNNSGSSQQPAVSRTVNPFAINEFRDVDLEATRDAVEQATSLMEDEETLPGLTCYTIDKMVDSMEHLELKEEKEEIPDSMAMEASILMYHFEEPVVQKLYSRRWMSRVDAIDQMVRSLDDDSIMALNGNSVQQVVTGVCTTLTRLFNDHALKVLVKSLELLDSFVYFMERNDCCAISSARQQTTRSTPVTCALDFIEVLISRLGDGVSAVVNCAICALLKVAESSTIPTYEDVANCILRSLLSQHQNPMARSICNRLRMLSTILLRAHDYNSHNMPRMSIKPQQFYEKIAPLCRHTSAEVRSLATETMAVGLQAYFKDVPTTIEDSLRGAANKVKISTVSVYNGDAVIRTAELLTEAQATWEVNILRSRTAPQ